MPKIIERLLTYDFIDEILIRDNSKTNNIINWGRYLLAKKASNDIIYVQDDDWLTDVEPLYKAFVQNPQKLVHTGVEDYGKSIEKHTYRTAQMAMAGFGMIFNRTWATVLDKYLKEYSDDYCFYRETDRIFSILLNEHHNFVKTDIQSLNDRDEHALSAKDDHLKYKALAIERALGLLK